MMKMMYSLSTGMPPIASVVGRRYCAPSRRFISSVSSCCADDELALELVLDLGLLLRGLELAPQRAQVAPQPRELALLVGRARPGSRRARGSAPRWCRGSLRSSSCSFASTRPPGPRAPSRCACGSPNLLSMNSRMTAPKRTADRVEERHAEDVEIAGCDVASHGQSLAGLRKIPPVVAGERPEGGRRHRVAFHRQQDHVHRNARGASARARARTA